MEVFPTLLRNQTSSQIYATDLFFNTDRPQTETGVYGCSLQCATHSADERPSLENATRTTQLPLLTGRAGHPIARLFFQCPKYAAARERHLKKRLQKFSTASSLSKTKVTLEQPPKRVHSGCDAALLCFEFQIDRCVAFGLKKKTQ